jgi:histidine ammonia-lyase
MSATRALDLLNFGSTTPLLEEAIRRFRTYVPAWTKDRVLSVPMARASEFISSGELNSIEDALAFAAA